MLEQLKAGLYVLVLALGPAFDWAVKVINVCGVLLNYYPQLSLMRKNNRVGAFSLSICFLMMTSHMLRIIYFFGTPYHVTYLIQNFVSILLQYLLLAEAIRIERGVAQTTGKPSVMSDMSGAELLKEFLALGVVVTALYLLVPGQWVSAAIGGTGVGLDLLVPMSQFVKNCKLGSVENLSFTMILLWLVGDVIKVIFMYRNAQPPVLMYAAVFVIGIELLIMAQFAMWRKRAV